MLINRMNKCFLIILIFVQFICSSSISAADNKIKICIIHSYHRDYRFAKNINKGIYTVLNSSAKSSPSITHDLSYEFLEIYMDTKHHNAEHEIRSIANNVLRRVRKYDPEIIVSSDDNAIRYVAARLLNTKYKIVFCGINGDPLKYGIAKSLKKPGFNITGVIERQPIFPNIKLIREIVGKPHDIIFFFDGSHSSKYMSEYLNARLKSEDGYIILKETGMNVREIFISNSWNKWKKKIQSYQDDESISFFFFSYNTIQSNGRTLTPFEIMDWVYENSTIPDFGLHIESGGIAGYGNSGYGQGLAAAEKVMQIIQNIDPGDIPIDLPKQYYLSINPKRAAQLGIEIPFRLLTIAELIR